MKLSLFGVMCFALASCIDGGENPNKAHEAELSQIDQHLTTLGLADEALYDYQYGFRLVIGQYGENPPWHEGQTVKLYYEGRLFPSGTLFDSGVKEGDVEDFLPEAFRYIVPRIMGGTSLTMYVPSRYGYGEQGSAALGVPANTILVYDLYLEKVNRTALEESRFEADSTAIANYLETNQIAAAYHPGGIWYTITQTGSGAYPTIYNAITADYKLKLLSNPGNVLQDQTIQQTSLWNLIDGFKVAMSMGEINVGTKATLYIPSGLAYGTNAQGSIPANANLIFEIDLKGVE
jgi:FKBP-type peptidyl-prolyl cis-trans isomerase FkpA